MLGHTHYRENRCSHQPLPACLDAHNMNTYIYISLSLSLSPVLGLHAQCQAGPRFCSFTSDFFFIFLSFFPSRTPIDTFSRFCNKNYHKSVFSLSPCLSHNIISHRSSLYLPLFCCRVTPTLYSISAFFLFFKRPSNSRKY